jgi:hypothetical protein
MQPWPRRRDTFADTVLNGVATRSPVLVFLAAYGASLLMAGVRGVLVERRLMTRKLP